jgi:2-dehydropantoate 2-reductase
MNANDMPTNRVAIIGAGGIGGYLAADLVRAGRDVTLCVRQPIETVSVTSGAEIREVRVASVIDPAAMPHVRWVLVTTKAQDTAGAAPWLAAARGATIVVVQNGIDHLERVRPIAPDAPILPAIIYCGVERTGPGRIVHHGGARMVVPAGADGAAFAALFAGTSFEIVEDQDFETAAWRKLLSNLVVNPISALTLRRAAVFREERVRDLAAGLLEEAVAVAAAAGAKLGPADVDRVLANLSALRADAGSSMLYDRLAGRPLEHEFLTGAVVRAAERNGIPVPLNRAILALLDVSSGRPLDASNSSLEHRNPPG